MTTATPLAPYSTMEGALASRIAIAKLCRAVRRNHQTRAREGFRSFDRRVGAPSLMELHDGRFMPWVPYQKLYTVMKRSRFGDIYQASGKSAPEMSANFESSVEVLADFVAGSIAPNSIGKLAADLRNTKHSDPVLGVICSYLYRTIADFDRIRRMACYCVDLVSFGQQHASTLATDHPCGQTIQKATADHDRVLVSVHLSDPVSIPRECRVSATHCTSTSVSSRSGSRTKPAGTPRKRSAVFMIACWLPNFTP